MDEDLLEYLIGFIDDDPNNYLIEYIENAVQITYNEMLTASKTGKDKEKVFQRHLNRLLDKFPEIEDPFGFEEAFWNAVEF